MATFMLGDYAEFARGRGKDRRPRRRRRTSGQVNRARRERAYSSNPYYGTKTARNPRRAELGTRSIRNTASGVRAVSNISGELRSWIRLASSLSGGSGR